MKKLFVTAVHKCVNVVRIRAPGSCSTLVRGAFSPRSKIGEASKHTAVFGHLHSIQRRWWRTHYRLAAAAILGKAGWRQFAGGDALVSMATTCLM